MNHDDVRERLGDYLEGDLGVGDRSAVDAHLSDCSGCREELRGLRATVALLRGLPDPAPPAALAESVVDGIRAGGDGRVIRAAFRSSELLRTVGALAAGLAGLTLLAWALQIEILVEPGTYQPARSIASAPDDAAGDATARIRRPPVVQPSPAASPSWRLPPRVAAFRGGVAPMPEIDELPGSAASNRERELDRQLELLLGDPSAFLLRMGPDVRGERFARLAQHAARRGQAGRVASRLISTPHPLTDELVPRFLAASLAVDLESRSGR